MPVRIVHAADFHLDSAFGALTSEQAKQRRREGRELLERLSNYVNQQSIDVVLLTGDLFDGELAYRETVETMRDALASMSARVFIAPGNHDYYSAKSLYATLPWPENVHIFRTREIERVELPELSCAVYGAAFTDAAQETSLLDGFTAPDDGLTHLMALHGDLNAASSRYSPLTKEQIEKSKLDYLALGHTHLHDGFHRFGNTVCAYAGCIERRGFDELGEKGILRGTVDGGLVDIKFIPFAKRRYELLTVDVTGKAPADALCAALPESTVRDIYRVVLTGETDERGVDIKKLEERFASDFFHLELRDKTHIRQDIWARSGKDSLRGLFLRDLRQRFDAADENEKEKLERAVRFGLAALDGRDL